MKGQTSHSVQSMARGPIALMLLCSIVTLAVAILVPSQIADAPYYLPFAAVFTAGAMFMVLMSEGEAKFFGISFNTLYLVSLPGGLLIALVILVILM